MRNWSQLEHVKDGLVRASIIASILAIMLLGTFSGISSPPPTASTARAFAQISDPPQNNNFTRIFVSPNITDTTIGAGSSVSFSVSINQTALLSGFNVVLQYDTQVLDAVSIDYSSGIFAGLNPAVFANCIDIIGTCIAPFNNLGQANLQLATFGSALTNVSGLLFIVNFIIKGKGLSIIHIQKGELSIGAGVKGGPGILPSINQDGYFNNAICGTQLCRPLAVKVFFSASPAPVVGRPIKFNATVTNPNKDALDLFTWVWGDLQLPAVTKTPNATHTYYRESGGIGLLTITLSVNDTYGITGLGSIAINVGRIWIQFSVNNFGLNPSAPSWPGTQISISVQVSSQSSANETSNLSVILDNGIHGNETLISKSLFMPATGSNTYVPSYVLDTTSYLPNVYRIVATIQLQGSNSTFYANDTSLSVSTLFLKLIQPLPSNASLSLFQAGGLGIGIVVALYALFVVFKRFFRTKEEL